MIESVRYERNQDISLITSNITTNNNHHHQQLQQQQLLQEELLQMDVNTTTTSTDSIEDGLFKVLCTHDGVLLKKASAEHIADLNTSGSLSLLEYTMPRRLYIDWRPNNRIEPIESILSADEGEWALVDSIRRTRTKSECKTFVKPPSEQSSENNSGSGNSSAGGNKPRYIRTCLEELGSLEVRNRGQSIRFLRKSDNSLHSEFFFQHGNADLFVHSMRKLHIIDCFANSRHGEYIILTTDSQKLKKTFAELDMDEIQASSIDNDRWLIFKGILDFGLPFHRGPPKSRPNAYQPQEQRKSTSSADNYQLVGLSGNNSEGSSGTHSRGSSLDKSPTECERRNVVQDGVVGRKKNITYTLPERQILARGAPLSKLQWLEFQTPDGRISDPTRVKELIFHGGIQENARAEIWKYLLNYYKWNDSEEEREIRRERKRAEYYAMKAQWLSMTTAQEANFSDYRDRKCQIEKDVKRTDRTLEFFAGEGNPNLMLLQGILMTYVMYNFDLGYVQGMSDLLAPILAVEVDEVAAFWCFKGFMDMVFANFDIDQAGMKTQFNQLRRLIEFTNPRLFNYLVAHESDNMYFCFRWLLVWYKREFTNDDVIRLWECLWTRIPCPNFHIFVSAAILDQQTDIIIDNNYEFTAILKHVNELSGHIDVDHTLQIAEAIYLQIKQITNLPNDIRQIIGEPTVMMKDDLDIDSDLETVEEKEDFDDSFDTFRELTIEEKRLQQEKERQEEEAYEQSLIAQYL